MVPTQPTAPASHGIFFSSVSDSLWPHGLQHARPPCPSPTPWVHSNLCPLSQWCHPTISSSVIPFSSHLQSFPASGSFQMSQFFASGGQSTGVSALASVLPMNTQDWSPLGWTVWICLQSKELPRVFSNTTVQKHLLRNARFSGPTPDPNPLQYSCLKNPLDRGAWWGYSPLGHKESKMTEVTRHSSATQMYWIRTAGWSPVICSNKTSRWFWHSRSWLRTTFLFHKPDHNVFLLRYQHSSNNTLLNFQIYHCNHRLP